MAGLAEPLDREPPLPSGPFSELARSQYKALASLRWSIFRHTLRTPRGALEAWTSVLAYVLYGCMGFGLAMAFGAGAYAMAANEKWSILPLLFWVVFIMWQVVPVTLASLQQQFDIAGLLRFPVGFGAFYLLHVIFGLVDVSTILGAFCCLGIWIGIMLVRPDMFAWVGLGLAVFAAFNILLVRAIAAWIDRWLAQRRTREIVGALFFLALMGLQLLNPAFRPQHSWRITPESRATSLRRLNTVNSIQRWLPPGLAAFEVQRSAGARPLPAIEAVSLLGVYVLAVGGVLSVRLRGEYRGENFGDAPSRKKVQPRARGWLIEGSGPLATVMEKELRVLLRAMPLIYGLAAPLLMVFVLSGLFLRHGAAPGHPMAMSLIISLGYAIVGFTQLFYNNLGPEGPGIQMLFLCPTPMRTVILGKNLFHAVLFFMDAVLVCVVTVLRVGWPVPAALAATAAWALFALPVHLAAGNLFSLNMPYRMNLGRMTRQRGSQASALLSMLVQIGVLGIGAGIFTLCSFFDRLWVATPVFLCLAGAATIAWMRVLDRIDEMASRRRESLIATLAKTE